MAVLYGAGALSIVFFALLCFPQAFRAWKKFAIWYVPFSVFVFATYDGPSPGDFLSPHPEQLFQWFSGFYVIVSLVIIFLTTGKNNK